MAQHNNGAAAKRQPIPLQVIDADYPDELEAEMFFVVGEAGEDIAFEVCPDIDMALGVREVMIEDGFAVKVYQATEIEVIDEEEPATKKK
jgi:hypothetical protein